MNFKVLPNRITGRNAEKCGEFSSYRIYGAENFFIFFLYRNTIRNSLDNPLTNKFRTYSRLIVYYIEVPYVANFIVFIIEVHQLFQRKIFSFQNFCRALLQTHFGGGGMPRLALVVKRYSLSKTKNNTRRMSPNLLFWICIE